MNTRKLKFLKINILFLLLAEHLLQNMLLVLLNKLLKDLLIPSRHHSFVKHLIMVNPVLSPHIQMLQQPQLSFSDILAQTHLSF